MNSQVWSEIVGKAEQGPTVGEYIRTDSCRRWAGFAVLACVGAIALSGWVTFLLAGLVGFGVGGVVQGYWRHCAEEYAAHAIVLGSRALDEIESLQADVDGGRA